MEEHMSEELFGDGYHYRHPQRWQGRAARRAHPTGRPDPAPSLFDYTDPLRPDERPLAGWSDDDLENIIKSWR